MEVGRHLGRAALLAWSLLAPAAGLAAQARVEAAPSTLVLLRVASDTRGQLQERALIDALVLGLDNFAVLGMTPEPGFADLPLRRQIADARALTEREGAVAAIWLGMQDEPIMLHLVARTDRTLVRTIEARRQPRLETSLALAVRELLGTAYLFEPEKSQEEPAVQKLVQKLVQEVLQEVQRPAEPPPPPPATGLGWDLRASAMVQDGVWGQLGSGTRFGGRLSGGLIFERRWRLGLSVEALRWPGFTSGEFALDGWSVAPGVEASPLWAVGPIDLGPVLGVQAVWERLVAQSDRREVFVRWRPQLQLGALLQWLVAGRVGVFVSPRMEANLGRTVVTRRSDGVDLASSPWIGFRVELGVVFAVDERLR